MKENEQNCEKNKIKYPIICRKFNDLEYHVYPLGYVFYLRANAVCHIGMVCQ